MSGMRQLHRFLPCVAERARSFRHDRSAHFDGAGSARFGRLRTVLLLCPGVPQVDTEIKDYIVDDYVAEVIPQSKKLQTFLDHYLLIPAALLIGIVLGLFIAR